MKLRADRIWSPPEEAGRIVGVTTWKGFTLVACERAVYLMGEDWTAPVEVVMADRGVVPVRLSDEELATHDPMMD